MGAGSENASAAELEGWRGLHHAPCPNGNRTALLLKNTFTLKDGTSSLLFLRGDGGKENTFIVCLRGAAGLEDMALERAVYCGRELYRS